MRPIDATSATTASSAVRITVPTESAKSNNKIIEPIPIVEPLPHYPLSATVSEMITRINEMISEQREASEKAASEQHSDQIRDEMAKLFNAITNNNNTADEVNIIGSQSKNAALNSVDAKRLTGQNENLDKFSQDNTVDDHLAKTIITADFSEEHATESASMVQILKHGKPVEASEITDRASGQIIKNNKDDGNREVNISIPSTTYKDADTGISA